MIYERLDTDNVSKELNNFVILFNQYWKEYQNTWPDNYWDIYYKIRSKKPNFEFENVNTSQSSNTSNVYHYINIYLFNIAKRKSGFSTKQHKHDYS